MTERERHDEPVIDLGQASVETKGQAIFDSDASSGKLNYVSGIAED
ncbi:benenodin family lasso peptide [Novosphingobium sp.]|nr:benenodin family lasso peptide [Novosphingobium sp.]MDP3906751.1 benenodin family lasso peptide [Novosphingobium sp.]